MENVKCDILNTAAALFKKCGLRSVSIDDVCKELHISKKTFYNYFKQKEELIEQVLHHFHEQNKSKKEPWNYEDGKNIIDVLMELDKAIKMNAEEENKHLAMLFDLEKYYPKIFQKRVEEMKEYNIRIMKTIINKGLEEGVFRQDLDIDLTALFIASQMGSLKDFVQNRRWKDFLQMFCFFRDVVIRILANEKGMEYYLKNYYDKN